MRSSCAKRIVPRFEPYIAGLMEYERKINGKENRMLGSGVAVQIVAGVLAAAVLGIIVYRRKQKAV